MNMSQNTTKYRKDYQAPNFYIDTVDLTVDLDDHHTRVTAITTVRRDGDHQEPLRLDGEDLKLLSVAIDGQLLESTVYRVTESGLEIDTELSAFELTLVTEIDPSANTKLEGLYKSGDAFCTQCEAEGFRRITYYLDRPDVMATFTTKVIADKAAFPYLLANGNPVASGDLDSGRHFVTWEDPFKKPAYLFALVAGQFDLLEDNYVSRSGRDIKLQLFVDPGNKSRGEHAMASLKRSMQWDEQRFNLEYDLDIYMIVAVDFFNMGAMENKGLNIFNSKYVLADTQTATDRDFHDIESVIGHEYFHNWTGNRITCRDWFQLSLKEGLTVFRDQEFSSDLGSRAVNRIDAVKVMRSHQFAEDGGPMAHPIRPDAVMEMNNFYTVTVYNKGAEVIRMIHTLLGERGFQQGMACYIERHDGQAVTCEDFVKAMEDGAGADLGQFRRWYEQAGTPLLAVTDSYDEARGEYRLQISQSCPPTPGQENKLPFHIPVDIELLDNAGKAFALANGETSQVLSLTEASQEFVFEGIASRPVPSLLREFSAPVKLDYPYTDTQLSHLMVHASNAVSRWDSAQQLLSAHILANAERSAGGESLVLPALVVDALRGVLLDEAIDPALAALILTLPTLNELAEQVTTVDVDGLYRAREFVKSTLASELADELQAVYRAQSLAAVGQDAKSVAARSLKNACLALMGANAQSNDLVATQFTSTDNMTDAMASLAVANENGLACRDTLMAAFEQRWSDNGLVMDKWFALEGARPEAAVLDRIQALTNHSAFHWDNPNRVRSLLGSFGINNAVAFHQAGGAGYRFLTDMLLKLNSINPQVASRLITPLMQWKKMPEGQAELMKQQLQRLMDTPDLAKDLYEKVSLSLAQ